MAVPDLQDAISHLQQNNPDAAIAALERKIDELPAHLTAHVLLARAYEAKEQWTKALESWENVRFLMPNSPVAREGRERILRRRRPDSANASPSAETASPDTASASAQASSPPPDDGSAEPSPTAADTAAAEDDPAEEDKEAAPSEPTDEDSDSSSSTAPPSPPEPDPSPESETTEPEGPTTASEAVSELEQLRQQAEQEARQGGARSGLSADAPSESTADAHSPSVDTPEERVREMNEDDDLERLIDELESARIEPNPDVEDVPTPDLDDDVDDIVSETLARIHEGQDQYRKAAQIYVKLASQEPDQARTYLQKASEMREQAEAQEKTGTDAS